MFAQSVAQGLSMLMDWMDDTVSSICMLTGSNIDKYCYVNDLLHEN